MSKKLLAILGSPNPHGATATMLDYLINEAKSKDWIVNEVHLYEKDIAFCKGCNRCMRTGSCVIDDDLTPISEAIKNCDMVVLAAPTYWANVPAIVKNMFDRLRGVVMEETNTFPKARLSSKQKYVLLTACNTPFPFSFLCNQSRGTIRSMKEFFKTAGLRYTGKVIWADTKHHTGLTKKLEKKLNKIL